MRKNLTLLAALLVVGIQASAGYRYHYLFVSGAPTYVCYSGGPSCGPVPPGSLGAWSASWDSASLIAAPTPPTSAFLDPTTYPNFTAVVSSPGFSLVVLKFYGDGALVTTFTTPFGPTYPFAFGSGGRASFPSSPGIYSYPGFGMEYAVPPAYEQEGQILEWNPVLFIIDTWLVPPPGPVWPGSVIRITAGPVIPTPGGPVEAEAGLATLSGAPIGSPQRVLLTPGQTTSVDFDSSMILAGTAAAGFINHADVVPVVTALNSAGVPIRVTTEVFDQLIGYGAVLTSTAGFSPAPPQLAPQGVASGQVMRLIATAGSPNSCVATLGFTSPTGAAIGPSVSVNLSPGQSQSLDLDASTLSLSFGQRMEVLPAVQIQAATPAGAPVTSVCSVSSDVFDAIVGQTLTYQTAFFQ